MQEADIGKLAEPAGLSTDALLQPRVAGCAIPLTAAQQRCWNHLIGQGTRLSMRVCSVAARVFGPLNTCLLRRCIDILVQRHESLRTRFVTKDGIPRQHVDTACERPLRLVDLSEVSPISIEEEVKRLVDEFVGEKIDLSVGPLFEAKLFRLSSREHVLILALDHMITDGVSNAILITEIWTLYHQAAKGLPFSLPQLPAQFGDYAVWQQQTYGAWKKEHEAYWRGRLTGAPRIHVPLDDGLAELKCRGGAIAHFSMGNRLSLRLRDLAWRERTTLALVLLTVYVALMARWCNQRDLVVVFVSNGRYRPELEGMIGLLASGLYLRIELTQNECFLDLLRRVNLEFYSACDHQDFNRVPDLIPECETELGFNLVPSHPYSVRSSVDFHRGDSDKIQIRPFPLACPMNFAPFFSDADSAIGVTVYYRPDLVAPSTVERFGSNIQLLAEEFVRRPLARIAAVSLATLRDFSSRK